jgi:hypothetical protein
MVQAARDALLVSATLAATPAPARKTQTQHAEHTQSDRGPSSWCKTHAQLMNEEGSEQLSASRLPSCSWQAALWDAPVYARHSFTHQQEHARRLRWRMAGGGHAVLFACCSVLLRQRQQLSAACMRARSACTCVPSALRARATRPRRAPCAWWFRCFFFAAAERAHQLSLLRARGLQRSGRVRLTACEARSAAGQPSARVATNQCCDGVRIDQRIERTRRASEAAARAARRSARSHSLHARRRSGASAQVPPRRRRRNKCAQNCTRSSRYAHTTIPPGRKRAPSLRQRGGGAASTRTSAALRVVSVHANWCPMHAMR